MIKRDGVELMNARTKNVSISKETIEVLKQGYYTAPSGKTVDISESLDYAVTGTVMYKDPLFNDSFGPIVPTLEVTNETTAQAAVRLGLTGKTNIVGLNFASARNPGGGFLSGALAQEEDLSRASGLYFCVKSKPIFYNENILCEDTFYTDNIIYSPDVPFFRDQYNLFLENPFTLSIISAPAPNVSSLKKEGLKDLLTGILRERAIKILQVAEKHLHKNIILGAWGCGAFGNDPKMVAEAFMLALEKVPAFEHVCFATYDSRTPPVIYETFKQVVGV